MLAVSTVIPHSGGDEILRECLNSLKTAVDVDLEVILVDNGSPRQVENGEFAYLTNLQILRYERKIGFAEACNRGVAAAKSPYVFLLNNDAVVEPDCLGILAEALDCCPSAAGCQPKIRSLRDRAKFDYSSAAGGELDRYGFPFARGRVFSTVEDDSGQYDEGGETFWGAGAALMIRRELYLEAGGLEESFFAHMEEIDLLWRLRLMGHRFLTVPEAVVWHWGAATIREGSALKMFLNHRNSLAMMVRNYGLVSLARYLPSRLAIDLILTVYSIFTFDFRRFWAVFRAQVWLLTHITQLAKARRSIQKKRRVDDAEVMLRMYSRSVVWQYFIRRRRTWRELQEAAGAGRRAG